MIAAALHTYALASNRVFAHERGSTVGASEIGACARRIFYAKNEGDRDYGAARDDGHADGWGARTRGSVYENAFWAPAIKAAFGDKALYVGADQRTFVDGFLSGTPDGLLIDQPIDALAHLGVPDIGGDSILLDAKSVDPRARLDKPKPEHVYQVVAGMGLVRALTNHRPAYAVLSYANASFWDDVREFAVPFDEAVYAEAKRRARDIMLATDPGMLKPEGVIAGGRECERCPYSAACGQERAGAVPESAAAVDPAFASAVADLAREAKALKEAGEAQIARARDVEHEIRAMLSEAGTKRLDHDGVKVVWSPVRGRPSWDDKAIRAAAAAAGVDIEKFCRVGTPSDRLAITVPEVPAPAGRAAAEAA